MTTPPTEAQMITMYRTMLEIRAFEEEILRREQKGLAIHSCAGHEGVAVAVSAQLTVRDLVVSNHRPWGHFLAKGGTLRESYAEILGHPEGVSHGTGGEMGICKPEIGFIQSTMIVGAALTLACGVAFSIQQLEGVKGELDDIAVVYFGEGASTNGAFHEALTLAKLFHLPLFFVCENNGLSGNTRASDYMPTELVVHRAMGYGIRTNVCDGSDALAVWGAAQTAIEYVRKERAPYLLECLVDRIYRHKIPRMTDVRSDEEKRIARMRDPLLKLRSALRQEGIMSEQQDVEYHWAAREAVAGAMEGL
jgi:acetoin:2,6-dichlorophenolindophenol oxidoreductase subunit alpha